MAVGSGAFSNSSIGKGRGLSGGVCDGDTIGFCLHKKLKKFYFTHNNKKLDEFRLRARSVGEWFNTEYDPKLSLSTLDYDLDNVQLYPIITLSTVDQKVLTNFNKKSFIPDFQ